jgi:hypothetical protein
LAFPKKTSLRKQIRNPNLGTGEKLHRPTDWKQFRLLADEIIASTVAEAVYFNSPDPAES